MATVSRNGSLQVTYTYNAAGQLASKTFSNGASTHYSYNSFNQLTRIEHRDNASAVIGFNNYAYDSHNRLISMTDAAGLTSYEYDPDGHWSPLPCQMARFTATTPMQWEIEQGTWRTR